MPSQGDVYSSCPVFCQASSGVFTNPLVSVIHSLPGTGKLEGADGFLALQESGREAKGKGDTGNTLPGVALHWGCEYPQGIGRYYM